MLGRKKVNETLALRIDRIAKAPTSAPEHTVERKFGKRAIRADGWSPGSVSFQSGERFDVVVKNISETGAKIEFIRTTYLPDRVRLTAKGVSRWAYVSWQSWGVAGLQFVAEDKA